MNGFFIKDKVQGRTITSSWPNGNLATDGSPIFGVVTNAPTYSSGVLQTASYQNVGSITQANIKIASGGGSNVQTSISSAFGQVWQTGTMNSNDRVRGLDGILVIDMNGNSWGDDGTTSRERTTHMGVRGIAQGSGAGVIGHLVGMNAAAQTYNGSGSTSTINYATGQFALISQAGTGTQNVGTARFITGQIQATAGTITNAIGFHLSGSWLSVSGSGSITNKYGILIEATDAPIVTSSAIKTSTTMTVGNYAAASMPTGAVGMIVAVNDHGGKLAYWDTTNSRWSYVFDNSAV
jgi:hypothetical protein